MSIGMGRSVHVGGGFGKEEEHKEGNGEGEGGEGEEGDGESPKRKKTKREGWGNEEITRWDCGIPGSYEPLPEQDIIEDVPCLEEGIFEKAVSGEIRKEEEEEEDKSH